MALVKMKDLLKRAEEKNIGCGAFSVGNMEMVKGAIRAAEELNTPIILQIAEVRLKNSPLHLMGPMMVQAAKEDGCTWHTGVVQSKDAFYGQHEPEAMPVGYELLNKWEAWKKMGCLASEMESAALFIVAAHLKVRCGSDFLVMGNQERNALGMDNPIVHDTEAAVTVGVEAIRRLIRADREK